MCRLSAIFRVFFGGPTGRSSPIGRSMRWHGAGGPGGDRVFVSLPPGGTLLAARAALQRGLACSTAGGTHHAFADHGSGYCFLNDLAVAARLLTAADGHRSRRVLIVDLDVHQVSPDRYQGRGIPGWRPALVANWQLHAAVESSVRC